MDLLTEAMCYKMQLQDLLHLAQTPGPMQGMALQALQELSDKDDAINAAPLYGTSTMGRGKANIDPDQLMANLISQYGEQAEPPSGDDQQGGMAPSQTAIDKWSGAMQQYEPSLWDKIKGIGSAISDDPSLAIDPAADMASYMTPVAGNMRGSQDFSSDAAALRDAWPRSSDHGDPLGVLMQYLPSLAGDVAQMLSPIGMGKPRMRTR